MPRDDCPNLEKNLEKCNCSYTPCSRKGICCECIHYHREKGQLPACYFNEEEESSYNRSIQFFVEGRS